ncbi:aquaporin isoform X1 [Nematostella vectensis]|uniref:aquaporin isoform X1 n=1 Tax=Nematostella vectensis TaxID=45351 RepID=UPI0020777F41|nr:aquaporin isoform X1 [Nematostella vectensis]
MITYCGFTKELYSRRFWTEILAEFIITSLFVSIVCGTALQNWSTPPTLTHMALNSGLAAGTFAMCMWDVSSGLFNPALTIGFLITGKKTLLQTIFYIMAQLTGSICGAAAIYGMASQHSVEASNLAVNARSPDVSIGQAVGMEIWATFILVLIVFAAGDSDRQHMRGYGPPLSIGIVVFINLSLTIPISGGSMNPARSFGPTVVMNFWKDHWMYWIGPIAGSCLASLCYHHVFAQRAINARISSAEEMPSKSHQNEGFNCLEVVCNKSQISENGQETNVCRL